MNIIFGKKQIEGLPENKFTILPLDTIKFGEHGVPDVAYCIVDNIPITELPDVDKNKELHNELINCYQTRQWDQCHVLITLLMGKWGKDLDSFYTELADRISTLKVSTLPDDWTPIITKNLKTTS